MAVPFSNTKLRVPKGFQNLLEGLAREVLRSQPNDVFAYGAMYFEKLVKLREETGDDPAVHGAQMEDRFYNNKSFQKPDVDSNDPSQQEAALKIQTKYRQYHAKQLVEEKRQDQAAVKIQAGFRGWEDRKKVQNMKAGDSTEQTAGAEEEEVDIDLNDPEVAAAAAKIQAGFKGHKARQEVKKLKEQEDKVKEKEQEEEVDIDLNDPDVQDAASKIQAGFRGLQTRKQMRAQQKEEEEKKVNEEEEEVDIDLNDPDVATAALKIQAGFRGLQDRQKVKALKEGQGQTQEAPPGSQQEEEEEEIDIDLNDPEVAKAAEKIQAGFKGMKTRKHLRGQPNAADEGNTD